MVIKRISTLTHQPINEAEIKHVKAYDETPQPASETPAPEAPNAEAVEAQTNQEPNERAQRRQEFKEANKAYQRAIQMQKEAEEKLKQAQRWEEVSKKAKEDPIEVAKALGLSPEEFLLKFQNKMLNIQEEETPKDPQEEIKRRLQEYEEERKREKEQHAQIQSQLIRNNYISSKILPIISTDKDKFQLLNYNNLETSAGFIYDMMNAHFQATGEELNPADVAEEMENQLMLEFEEKINAIKKISRFSKHFREEEPQAQTTAQAQPQLGSKSKTLSDSLSNAPPSTQLTSSLKQKSPLKDRNARIQRIVEKLDALEKTK